MSITSFDQHGGSFLNFNSSPPRIYLTSVSPVSEKALLSWKEEGFDTQHLPYDPSSQAAYIRTLKTLGESISLGDKFAIVAYGEAAGIVLKIAMKPLPKCCAIIAFYPPVLPSPKTKFPMANHIQVHVAGLSQASVRPEMYDWKLYRYDKNSTGFAEPSSNAYSDVEANLAWSRSLACVRNGFNHKSADLEPIIQNVWNAKYEDDVPERASMAVVQNMTQNSPHISIFPTLEGGVGRKKVEEFYREFFVPSLVEDFKIRLVSRTIGADRVVDEMVVSFTHSDEVDWILPGVQPTDKFVEIPMVSIIAVRGGKLVSEHMYWDQASVLMQVGLLDPKVVPKNLRAGGLKRLPVVGAEAAKQLVEPQQQRYNKLLQEHGLMDGLEGLNGN
ncbi:NTF2-like protein [Cucurbitaria berberidis CBS 394.84]|uniref:NTF2-like protein n=1 Tax=Cucurbitaria berberidis CBS 394.84 TaxID=1168544 RepID=A0A9P4GNT4_9PLEO|nr:NTF2-like protein [Cucurbitaria berberidis CBS 394.84]KAF1848426.1 NTF2-like protein [Cucurbitaria berberidis CBS 394.84]